MPPSQVSSRPIRFEATLSARSDLIRFDQLDNQVEGNYHGASLSEEIRKERKKIQLIPAKTFW